MRKNSFFLKGLVGYEGRNSLKYKLVWWLLREGFFKVVEEYRIWVFKKGRELGKVS